MGVGLVEQRLWTDQTVPPPSIVVDEPGVGGGCIDAIRARGWDCLAFNGGSSPSDSSGRFLNRRAQTCWILRTALENGKVALPRDALLEEELLALTWSVTTSGKVQLLAKSDVRGELGRSPDRADAVCIGLAESLGYRPRAVLHSVRI